MIHFPVHIVGNLVKLPCHEQIVKGGSFLDLQAVEGNMFRCKGDGPLQGVLPDIHGMTRNSKHQIHVNVVKAAGPCHLVVADKILCGMNSAQSLQTVLIKRLQSHRQPVDPRLPVSCELFFRQSPGVGLYGDLRIFCDVKVCPEGCKHLSDQARLKDRRRAAADKDGIHQITAAI